MQNIPPPPPPGFGPLEHKPGALPVVLIEMKCGKTINLFETEFK